MSQQFDEEMQSLLPVWVLLKIKGGRQVVDVVDPVDPGSLVQHILARLDKIEEAVNLLIEVVALQSPKPVLASEKLESWQPVAAFELGTPPYEAQPEQEWKRVPRRFVRVLEDGILYTGPRDED